MTEEYESELTASRAEVAAALKGVADGVLTGSIRLGDTADATTIAVPEEMTLEMELETEDGQRSLELEMEWPHSSDEESTVVAGEEQSQGGRSDEGGSDEGQSDKGRSDEERRVEDASDQVEGAEGSNVMEGEDEAPSPARAADGMETLAGFEIYRDQADEWRWRLRHRNGNIIATSGEGYTRKHNARKGLRSVVQNAPGAEVSEGTED